MFTCRASGRLFPLANQGPQRTECRNRLDMSLRGKQLAHDAQQIIQLPVSDLHMLGAGLMFFIGGSNQGELIPAAPRDQENDSTIGLEMRNGMIARTHTWDHDMRSADQAQGITVAPGPTGIHQLARSDLEFLTPQGVRTLHTPETIGLPVPSFG